MKSRIYINGFVCTVWEIIWFSRAFKKKSNMSLTCLASKTLLCGAFTFPVHSLALRCLAIPSLLCRRLGLVVLVLVFVLWFWSWSLCCSWSCSWSWSWSLSRACGLRLGFVLGLVLVLGLGLGHGLWSRSACSGIGPEMVLRRGHGCGLGLRLCVVGLLLCLGLGCSCPIFPGLDWPTFSLLLLPLPCRGMPCTALPFSV
jgi:hypothetical protein